MMSRLVFLDIETNGLDPNYHQPIEIGWVTLDGVGTTFSLEFDEEQSDPGALEVNGWGRRRFPPIMLPEHAVDIMQKELGQRTIVANNVTFDLSFLAAWLRRNGGRPTWNTTGFELKSLVAGRLGISPGLVSTSKIVEHFKIEAVDKHTALGDAQWNREIYLALNLYEG